MNSKRLNASESLMPCSSEKRYGIVSRWLHWLMAFLILGMIACGLSLSLMPGTWKPTALFLHQSFGALILFLTLLRLGRRMQSPPPPLSDGMSRLAHRAAAAGHGTLYALMLAMPLSGWAMISAAGKPADVFGMFTLPPLLDADRALTPQYREWHETLAYTLLALIALHVGAALYHHFIRRDDVLRRML